MINVAALRMQQFGVQFYQASLTARDIDKLVRFEVLNYGEHGAASRAGSKPRAERRSRRRCTGICSSAASRRARRPISARSSARRSTSSSQYYEQCRQARDLPSIPGAVIISCDEKLSFEPCRATTRARHSESARARRHPPRDRRPAPPARAARGHRSVPRRGLQRSRRSSSIGCPKITSSRCS